MKLISRIAERLRSLVSPSETLEGYENPELVESVFQKTLAYRPTMPALEIGDARAILDFGGGCGAHFKEAQSPTVRWAVVETPAMVKRAAELSTDRLRFFSSIRRAAEWLGTIDMMHSSGALQYTPAPAETLAELCSLGAGVMYWRRMNLSAGSQETETQTSRLAENGPGRISGIKNKAVKYRLTKLPEAAFLAAHAGYRLTERTADSFRFVRGGQ